LDIANDFITQKCRKLAQICSSRLCTFLLPIIIIIIIICDYWLISSVFCKCVSKTY